MPRPRPIRAELRLYRGFYYIFWWDGDGRRRTSSGSADIIKARVVLADFNAKGPIWDNARSRAKARIRLLKVYVIGSESGQQKIGVAIVPTDRVPQLQTGHPYKLTLIKEWEVTEVRAEIVERRAHRLLAERRMSGEWFSVPPAVACAAVELSLELDLFGSSHSSINLKRSQRTADKSDRICDKPAAA